jgi:hypothetical protein
MAVTTPDWLAQHDGNLQAAWDAKSYLVMLGNKPQYQLVPVPAGGKFACAVTQTVNGRRLDRGGTFPTLEDAVRGGLEDLRSALGW